MNKHPYLSQDEIKEIQKEQSITFRQMSINAETFLKEFENLLDIRDNENFKILEKCLKKIDFVSTLIADKKGKKYLAFLAAFEKLHTKLKDVQ